MESPPEDDEITLLRQSKRILKDLGEAFERIEDVSNERELDSIVRKIEPYQEDPQLLDTELGNFITLLSDKFLHNLQLSPVLRNLSRILYTFCKVRGEKVIVGLLNNEPRWIEPLLEVVASGPLPWEQNYVMLLWLSHLMLSPFDLATISSFSAGKAAIGVTLPEETPSIASQVVQIGLEHLSAPTIERKAASSLLVRLCIRQDMLNLGLLGIITRWAITECGKAAREANIHACLGTLTLLSGLVASADQRILGSHLASAFRLSRRVLEDGSLSSIKSSAIARKLVIKILRNTVVHCLQAEQSDLDTTEVVEQVIGALIELLADPDTPVRMAASKALSLVTLKLDPEMAAEVVEAVNASFHEELVGDDATSFFSVNAAKWHGIVLTFGHLLHRRAVTQEQIPGVLQSILYALSFEQRSTAGKSVGSNVRDAANYGLWAVARRCTTQELEAVSANTFAIHKPAHTTSSIQYIALNLLVSASFDPDGNVRRGSSAALQELIGRHPNTIIEGIALVQVVDYQAVGLRPRAATKVALAAARLDNLYERTLTEALFTWRGLSAASLPNRTDSAVFAGLLIARCASEENESLKEGQDLRAVSTLVEYLFARIRKRLFLLRARDQEERQGLLLSASWIFSALNYAMVDAISSAHGDAPVAATHHLQFLLQEDALSIPEFASLLSEDFKPRGPRSELVISAALRLFGQLAGFLALMRRLDSSFQPQWDKQRHFSLLSKCLSRSDEIVLRQVPTATTLSISMLSGSGANEMVRQWLSDLAPENKRPGVRESARILALGAAFVNLPPSSGSENRGTYEKILIFLLERYVLVETEAKIVILQSLHLILGGFDNIEGMSDDRKDKYLSIAATMLLLALHDYTISERGDVGSLVRLAALAALQEAWSHGLLLQRDRSSGDDLREDCANHLVSLHLEAYDAYACQAEHLRASVLRLSLEKLDKVRLAAAECWRSQDLSLGTTTTANDQIPKAQSHTTPIRRYIIDEDTSYLLNHGAPFPPKTIPDHDITSTLFFHHFLVTLTDPSIPKLIKLRILEGFCSTAGGAGLGASQNLLNTREALHLFLTAPKNAEGNRIAFMELIRDLVEVNVRLKNDQRLVAILEVAAFATDMGLLSFQGLPAKSFLASIQKSHYKSKNIRKLQICLDVYRGLASVPEVRSEAVKLIVGMLLHPIPAVRIAAAEAVLSVCDAEEVVKAVARMDWTRPAKGFKEIVAGLRISFDSGSK